MYTFATTIFCDYRLYSGRRAVSNVTVNMLYRQFYAVYACRLHKKTPLDYLTLVYQPHQSYTRLVASEEHSKQVRNLCFCPMNRYPPQNHFIKLLHFLWMPVFVNVLWICKMILSWQS